MIILPIPLKEGFCNMKSSIPVLAVDTNTPWVSTSEGFNHNHNIRHLLSGLSCSGFFPKRVYTSPPAISVFKPFGACFLISFVIAGSCSDSRFLSLLLFSLPTEETGYGVSIFARRCIAGASGGFFCPPHAAKFFFVSIHLLESLSVQKPRWQAATARVVHLREPLLAA